MKDCVIIGAGLSGLSAAHHLIENGLDIVVIEKSGQVGGLIQSHHIKSHQGGSFLLEAGPNTFPSTATALINLCQAIGLQLEPTSSLAKKRYLYQDQQLNAVPTNPLSFLLSPILSVEAKLKLLQEPWQPRYPGADPSLADFIRHRLGDEILEQLVTPLISGIYAGNPEQLSMSAIFPKLFQLEQQHGSLFQGLLASRFKQAGKAKIPYQLLGLKTGLGELPKKLAQSIPADCLWLNTTVNRVEKIEQGYTIACGDYPVIKSKSVIIATPAFTAASLLASLHPEISKPLEGISYAPMAVVHLAFEAKAIAHPMDGFGFLIPRTEQVTTLGCIWSSRLFPDRSPTDTVLMSCFLGGALSTQITTQPSEVIAAQALKDLQKIYKNPHLLPVFQEVITWPQAIPQYNLGHQQRLQTVADLLANHAPGLQLCGNYQHGVSLNDCVLSGQQAAASIKKIKDGNESRCSHL